MADDIHAVHNGNAVDVFSDDSDVILDSNQAVVEPIDRHKLMTTGCNFGIVDSESDCDFEGFHGRWVFDNFVHGDALECGMDGGARITVF